MDINKLTKDLRTYAPSVVRYGLALVVLWFGINQITNPVEFIGYVPNSVVAITGFSVMMFVKLNGIFEIVMGTLLLVGWQVRWVALLLSLHLFGIMYTVGYNEIGVRDFGLAVALFSIFMHGSDPLSIHQHKYPSFTK